MLFFPLGNASFKNLGGMSAHMSRALGNWQSDRAVDLGAPPKTKVYAIDNGRIATDAGFGFRDNGSTVWGYRLTLVTANNRYYYAHLGGITSGIRPGTRVKKGRVIGWIGDSPRFTPHLHLGVMVGDPDKFLSRAGFLTSTKPEDAGPPFVTLAHKLPRIVHTSRGWIVKRSRKIIGIFKTRADAFRVFLAKRDFWIRKNKNRP